VASAPKAMSDIPMYVTKVPDMRASVDCQWCEVMGAKGTINQRCDTKPVTHSISYIAYGLFPPVNDS
jgi:hypothetical protein